MIESGGDGISRGDLFEGIMAGKNILEFLPIGKGALERSPEVETWLRSWGGDDIEFLSAEGWFERGHEMTRGEALGMEK